MPGMRISTLLVVMTFVFSASAAQQPLRVGSIAAAPGTMASGTIEIAARSGDQGRRCP